MDTWFCGLQDCKETLCSLPPSLSIFLLWKQIFKERTSLLQFMHSLFLFLSLAVCFMLKLMWLSWLSLTLPGINRLSQSQYCYEFNHMKKYHYLIKCFIWLTEGRKIPPNPQSTTHFYNGVPSQDAQMRNYLISCCLMST